MGAAMTHASASFGDAIDEAPARSMPRPSDAEVAIARLVNEHHDFIWRSIRRLGINAGDVDDAVQRVFLIASRKLLEIREGAERSFLFQTAVRVASDARRSHRRRRESSEVDTEHTPASPGADELIDLRRARTKLDEILDDMPLELRAVFVLFELDEVTMAEIANLLDLPPGTVASRLRRAREMFQQRARRLALSRQGIK
jgi:RNA polymerase sigma-70 factor (ECF subfamily)